MKRLVITLGMHRSGTSLLSAALEGIGVEYGGELIGPAPDNPKGFWEDCAVVALSERMYQRLGVTSSTLGVDCTRMDASARWRFQLQIARWLRTRLRGEGLLGLKDPRLPRLMDIWSPVLDRLEVDYWLLIPLRNPLSVAASLTARDGFSTGKGLLLWYEHMVRALQFSAGRRFVVVDYDRFLEQPETGLGRVATWLGVQPDPRVLDRFRSEVFDPKLRHAAFDLEALERHPDSFPDLIRLYRALVVLSNGQVHGRDQGVLRDIEQLSERFADLWSVLRQCGQWDMELWTTGQFCQQQVARLQQCSDERLRREAELLDWISTLEHTIQQQLSGREEAESWFRQAESGWREQLKASAHRITSLAQDLDALQFHVGGLQLRLDQILASRSWRLTAPLRRCREWWARVRMSSSSN